MKGMVRLLLAVATGLAAISTSVAWAQSYPERPITLVVPYPPGGTTDLVARIVTHTLSKELGQPVVVENAPGAAGMIGMNRVARAKPDGYTLGWGLNGPATVVPYMTKAPLYDPAKAFVPVGLVSTSSYLMVARPDLGVSSLAELIAKAKTAPGKYTYGSIGIGSSTHLMTELLMSAANIDLLQIPYKGEADTIRALLSNEIDVTWVTLQSGAPLVASGKVKGVFTTGPDREKNLPSVPTLSESGRPDLTVETFFGILAPTGTPQSVIDALNKAMKNSVTNAEYVTALEKAGLTPKPSTPEQFGALLNRHQQRWVELIKARNIVAE